MIWMIMIIFVFVFVTVFVLSHLVFAFVPVLDEKRLNQFAVSGSPLAHSPLHCWWWPRCCHLH